MEKEPLIEGRVQELCQSFVDSNFGDVMVVGGGISGLTTTLEAAEVGYEVFLVEKPPVAMVAKV